MRVTLTCTAAGITVLRSASTRALSASATSMAFSPGFFVIAIVTAGLSVGPAPSRPGTACQTYRAGGGGPSRTVATSLRNTGLPPRTPTISSRTSFASCRNGPASIATDRLPPMSSPTGRPRLAPTSACRRSDTVTPTPAIRAGSISTVTARPGPPTVVTSRVPRTRFRSASMLCATRSRSSAPVAVSVLCSVSVRIGTSSMLLALTIGASVPKVFGSQSACDRAVSWSRTSASVRGTPTLNCTVTTASPGRDTDITCSTPAICASTCSAGPATICSTSRTAAPGNGISTLAIVTSICGSSSRGVTSTA